jgi:pyruvate,water dikinase
MENQHNDQPAGNDLSLFGQIAYKGKVIGTACVLHHKADLLKFQQGQIAVVAETTVDFLPVMKRAIALVSERGGMICHAASIAREMQVPCVVGVKDATKLLHDGDEVEVDADHGVVRIIKKT